jgi:Phage integrase, N-terminal SAM-like domain
MTTTTPEQSTGVLLPVTDPLFTADERQALGGFLSGYSGLTRDAYTLDLRQYTAWCTRRGLHLFEAKRIDIESFRGDMELAGRARATIARRLCTIAGFYRYAEEEDHWRTPRPRTCAGHGWTTSHTRPRWTATSWARCWSPPGSVRPKTTP